MSGRERDKFRKYDSGASKAKKRKLKEEFNKRQKGALDKYVQPANQEENLVLQMLPVLDSSATCEESTAGGIIDTDVNNEPLPVLPVLDSSGTCAASGGISDNDGNEPLTALLSNANSPICEIGDTKSACCENISAYNNSCPEIVKDIYDPGNWEHVTCSIRDLLVEKGPIRLSVDHHYPNNEDNRHFSNEFYTRKMPNGEHVDRRWLVYSQLKDAAFCFCCKLYGTTSIGRLANEGSSDWKHLSGKLQAHEVSPDHVKRMKIWLEAVKRMSRGDAIDNKMIEQIRKEKFHWHAVLTRILAVVQYLAENNSAFRGKTEKLYERNNGNFLGLIEMLVKFDPVMEEHVRRIKDRETHNHYLGHNIQNELIELMASEVKKIIIDKLKLSKYFAIILDCTPDVSHKEQMSLIVRFVDVSQPDVKVVEHFVEFFIVEDTTGKGLSDSLLATLEKFCLNIHDCRGQGYDNGANMKGKHEGVQAHILRANCRAFFTPCGCHNLNLVLGDMAKCSSQAMSFFGALQRIYVMFAASPARWKTLQETVPYVTTKSLSETRWECRLESVKALRYQISEIREALFDVAEETKDPMVKAEAESLANEVGNFEFILATIIWYDILFAVNTVSKLLQSSDMQLDVAIHQIKGLITYLTKYRDTGFHSSMITAKEIASEMGVDQAFKQRRNRRRRAQFDYENTEEATLSAEQIFRTGYFLCIIDQALTSMKTRFEQLQHYDTLFGFLYNINTMRHLNDEDLLKCCMDLDAALRSGDSRDLDGVDLCTELKIFREILPESVRTAMQCLQYVWAIRDSFPNTAVGYRILLTVPVTVASAERSFSKLKLIKNYLRSTMSQDRLCGLAMLSIEKDIASTLDYEGLISEFSSRKSRKVNFHR